MEKEIEIWKPVVGYEGLYEVSSLGRVKSIDRTIPFRNSKKNIKGTILSLCLSHDYYEVSLYKDGIRETGIVHRLVANAFISNPNNYPCVNHKNEIKTDNRIENLEWCTYEYNNNYDTKIERASKSLRTNPKASTSVFMLNKKGDILRKYQSIADAQDDGFDAKTISKCCRFVDKYITHKSYIWIYSKDIDKIPFAIKRVKNKIIQKNAFRVIATNNFNKEQKEYESINEASRSLGISVTQIIKCCRGIYKQTNGYTFKYAE